MTRREEKGKKSEKRREGPFINECEGADYLHLDNLATRMAKDSDLDHIQRITIAYIE